MSKHASRVAAVAFIGDEIVIVEKSRALVSSKVTNGNPWLDICNRFYEYGIVLKATYDLMDGTKHTYKCDGILTDFYVFEIEGLSLKKIKNGKSLLDTVSKYDYEGVCKSGNKSEVSIVELHLKNARRNILKHREGTTFAHPGFRF